jgi:cell division protein FtsA
VSVKHDKETFEFERDDINEIIEARLEEVFELIGKELKKAGKHAKLPSGVVLTGGGAKLKHMVDYTKDTLGVAARVGGASGFGGVAEHLDEPQFATAAGLMLIDATAHQNQDAGRAGKRAKSASGQAGGVLKRLLGRFKA